MYYISENELKSDLFLQDINMILSTGQVPDIFSTSELEDIFEVTEDLSLISYFIAYNLILYLTSNLWHIVLNL